MSIHFGVFVGVLEIAAPVESGDDFLAFGDDVGMT